MPDGIGDNADIDDDNDGVNDEDDLDPTNPDVGTGISTSEKLSIKLYPNPSDDFIMISATDNLIKEYRIIDSSGSISKQESVYGSNIHTDITEFKKGLYIIMIETENGFQTMKFMKH